MKDAREIAIVGVAGMFPGAADVDALLRNVLARSSAARDFPPDRLPVPAADVLDPRGSVDHARGLRACLLDPFTLDATGLDLPAALLPRLSTLARLTLHVGGQAFRSARLADTLRARTGVILANIALPTDGASKLAEELLLGELDAEHLGPSKPRASADPLERYPTALPAGLLATALGLGGGSFALDAACASSLYALYLACDELESGRMDAVIAGGVSLPQALYTQIGFTQLHALSASGVCAPFDARADGLVVGEGAGMFVLRRLADAERDGDSILAVIRGIGLSNDVGGSLLSPDSEGQLRATTDAYREAGWSPADVDLIECHGTGTPRGDAVELESLSALWATQSATTSAPKPCVLGSVKSNVGHLLTAAGAAGLCKVLGSLREKVLPPSANFSAAHAAPALTSSPFRVLEAPEPWEPRAPGVPRRAAVSGFGFGGINAHLLLEEHVPDVSTTRPPRAPRPSAPVAIVGLGAHFGTRSDRAAVSAALFRGERENAERPRERTLGRDAGSLPGGWLPFFSMPLGRFRIPPRELHEILPQQLLMLKVAAEALDDFGARGGRGLGSGPHARAGAVVGLGLDLETTTFHLRWLVPERVRTYARARGVELTLDEATVWGAAIADSLGVPLDATRTLGALGGIVTSRLAREFQLGGPSFGVFGEEASGLRALAVATRMLQRGQTDVMLVGAVDLAGDLRQVRATDALRPYSRTGKAAPFDAASDGVLFGEGAAAIVLKRLDDAERDGDHVYAVVKGVGVAGGASLSRGPSRSSTYARAVAAAHAEAAVSSQEISLLLAQGSGDRDEAQDELHALGEAFAHGEGSDEPQRALTSAAATLGHAGAASGLANVVLGALALHEEILPPLAGFTSALPDDDALLARGGFHVLRHAHAWLRHRASGPRRAGVSSMSLDGTCMHVVLEAAPESEASLASKSPRPLGARAAAIFVCRGDEARLRSLATRHDGDLEALAARFYRERDGAARPVTTALVVESLDELRTRLAGMLPTATPINGKLAFVFPGSGNHYVGMGRSLGVALPEIARALDREVLHLAGHLMPAWVSPYRRDWAAGWEDDSARALALAPERMILGQVAHGVAVADAVRLFGITPTIVLGYSLGESAGLFASRTWRDRDLMFQRTLASPLFRTELSGACTVIQQAWGPSARFRAVLVARGEAEVRAALVGSAALLIVNAPGECVVGGEAADVARVIEALGCGAIELEGVPSVHLPVMEPVAKAYRELHVLPCTPPPETTFFSGAWGKSYEPTSERAADSIVQNARAGFDFTRTVEAAYEAGARVFVELGPQGSCTRMIGRILAGREHVAVSACQRGQDGYVTLLRCLARLALAGISVDLEPIYGARGGIDTNVAPAPKATRCSVGRLLPKAPPMPERVNAQPLGDDVSPRPAPRPLPLPSAPHVSPLATTRATADAHEAFLALSRSTLALQAEALLEQQRLLAALLQTGSALPGTATLPAVHAPKVEPPAFDHAMCMEFAIGSLAKVLGPEFAAVDTHPTRVRLPDDPLMLCHRIMSVEGEKGVLGPGRCVTEHDVVAGAWYLDAGRAPVCISVEAGQADLFLSAYLGIDFETRGRSKYRLLDAKIVFHRGLPVAGETIRYDIRIDRFIRQGDTWLFFFRFDGTIAGQPFITMYDGCAGFFTEEQLASGRGIVQEPERTPPPRRASTQPFAALLPPTRESMGVAQLAALRSGDLGAAFGGAFEGRTLAPAMRLPGGRLHLVDRVVEFDTQGGAFGLGTVLGESDVSPDAWYLTCHFEGDPVMPGTLMYECCLHTLRVLLLRMGVVTSDVTLDVHYAPIEGVASQLRCRGQVLPTTRTVGYKVDIKEIGYDPELYVLANASMFADGRHVVEMLNMSVRVRGLDKAALERTWGEGPAPNAEPSPELFTRAQILAYAEGNPSECFGAPYLPFDRERKLARLPRPPFLFVDRVTRCEPPPFVLRPGGWIECEFDVPKDAWYFAANRQRAIPFAVLLEAALQPCGWLAAYVGSALTSEEDLKFRNLDGHATALAEVYPDAGTLTLRARLTKASQAGGMLLEEFDMEILAGSTKVYSGQTGFGFFPAAALAQQVGVRGAAMDPLPEGARAFDLDTKSAPLAPSDCATHRAEPHGLALPSRAFLMVDRITALELEGGPKGLGFVAGAKRVNPSEWFFEAHFFEDPVMPGSLGLEAVVQLMKVFARERFAGLTETHRAESMALGREHRWQYRGQVIPTNGVVSVQAVITAIEDGDEPTILADGKLAVDGRVIYTMRGFALRLRREERR